MNLAHLHLILIHFPVAGTVSGIFALGCALASKSDDLVRASLWVFAITALFAIGAFLTGNGAEKIVERLPGAFEAPVERHEAMAAISFAAIEIAGAAALAGLFFSRRCNKINRWYIASFLALAVITAGLVAEAASLGGQIRHTEIRKDFHVDVSGMRDKNNIKMNN